ncbi:MAG: hypothetical protein MZV63_48750 [Marinilabiliales bacterium]|nr:hypothetical protein [Marinilabiliales bacterium]
MGQHNFLSRPQAEVSSGVEECCRRSLSPGKRIRCTWNKQPKTTEANQVFIAPFILNANIITVDVTKLYVQDPATDDVRTFRVTVCSSGSGRRSGCRDSGLPRVIILNARMRPKLTIYYTLPQ